MSAQLMALVRELKALNARKKAGEALSPTEEARRKELKAFLKAQLEPGAASAPETSGPATAPSAPMSPQTAEILRPSTVDIPLASVPLTPPPQPTPQPPAPMAPRPAPPTPTPAAAPAAPARPAFVPKKDAYAIAGAGSFIDAAMNSEAVAKVDPWANRQVHASEGDIADAEAAADAALRANKRARRARTPEEVEAELRETQAFYTPPEESFVLEQYYGDYFGDGLELAASTETADLKPIDPREIDARRAMDVAMSSAGGATTVAVPSGLAFLDDYPALYTRGVLPPPNDTGADVDDPTLLIGRRKVTVHLLNGEKKQGNVRALRRGELGFKLEGRGPAEEIALASVKAVFVHLQPNAQQRTGVGKTITVVFKDQRAVQGESGDYEPSAPVFSLVPPAGRGQFEKIIINTGAVLSVS